MKERRFVYLAMVFMLAFLATPAQYSLGMASAASTGPAAAGRTANPSQLAAPNGLSDPIITLNPAVPDHTDPLNATLNQDQLNLSSYWNFYGSAPELGAYYAFYEDAGGLHIGVQPLKVGDWAGFFGVTPSTYATLAQATITAPSRTINGYYVTGLYSQTSVPGINGTFCGAVISSSGIVWQVSQINGTAYQATNFDPLWTDDSANQSLTRTCTMITNGDNYLAAFLDGQEVYENSSLSLNMPSPFIWFLESQSSVPDHMAYGTFLAFHSSIVGESFDPADVTINAGSTVQWVVPGGPDTITSDSGNWSSGPLSSGGSFSHTFTTPGVYGYHSIQHPWAEGTITVLPDPVVAGVRGTDDRIYYDTCVNSSWTGWQPLPSGTTIDSPAIASSGGTLNFVVKGSSPANSLWFGSVQQVNESFSGWTQIPGATPSKPALAAGPDGNLYLVVRGMNDQIWLNAYNGTWSGWNALPGSTPDAPAVAVVGDVLHVVVMGSSPVNSLWDGTMNLTTRTWLGWTPLSGASPSPASLAVDSTTGTLYLAVRGLNGIVYVSSYDGASWTGWSAVPWGTTTMAPAITVTNGMLCLAAVGGSPTNSIWFNSMNITNKTWAGWTMLDGSTLSPPAATYG